MHALDDKCVHHPELAGVRETVLKVGRQHGVDLRVQLTRWFVRSFVRLGRRAGGGGELACVKGGDKARMCVQASISMCPDTRGICQARHTHTGVVACLSVLLLVTRLFPEPLHGAGQLFEGHIRGRVRCLSHGMLTRELGVSKRIGTLSHDKKGGSLGFLLVD